MLTEQNSGRYLSAEWHRKRAQAMIDRTRFSQQELEWLEVEEHQGRGEQLPARNRIESTPIVGEPYARERRRMIDIRDRPEAGGRD